MRLRHNLFHAPDLPALQTDLDAVRMIRGLGEDVLDDAFRQLAGALILFQDDQDLHPWFDVRADLTIHNLYSF